MGSHQQNVYQLNERRTMPSERGFTPLWRDIDKQPWYKLHKGRYTAVWIHLMIKAAHGPRTVNYKGVDIDLMPGQVAKTYNQLAKELNQTKSDIQNALKTFIKHGQITTQSFENYTLIIFKNWSKFNTASDTGSNTVSDTRKPASIQGIKGSRNTVSNTGSNTAANTQKNNYLKNNGIEQENNADATASPTLPDFAEERTKAFEHFWHQWGECKKLLGRKNTASKTDSRKKFLTKVFTPAYVRRIGLQAFMTEIDALCDQAWHAHEDLKRCWDNHVESDFFHIEKTQPCRFLSGETWRDNA